MPEKVQTNKKTPYSKGDYDYYKQMMAEEAGIDAEVLFDDPDDDWRDEDIF